MGCARHSMSDEDAQLDAKILEIARIMRTKELDIYNLTSLFQASQPRHGDFSKPVTREATLNVLRRDTNNLGVNIWSVLRHRHPENFLREAAELLLTKYELHKPCAMGGAGPAQPGPATFKKTVDKPSVLAMGGAAAEEIVNWIDSDDEEKPSEKSGKRFQQLDTAFKQAEAAFLAAKAARDAAEAEFLRDLNQEEEERATKRPRA